ncbi:MAG: nucleoid occlusion factor SlmA [Gammaproteobacteria bacterium]
MSRSRRQHILEVLASELERKPGNKITTASLARAVGVSEAALYRHFPSKARMFEELISFAEHTVFSRINQINAESQEVDWKCERICTLVMTFAVKNPGITRLLMGDVLVGEKERLRRRTAQFFARLEVEIKQTIRLADPRGGHAGDQAALLIAYIDGRLTNYVRSDFEVAPLDRWEAHWPKLRPTSLIP